MNSTHVCLSWPLQTGFTPFSNHLGKIFRKITLNSESQFKCSEKPSYVLGDYIQVRKLTTELDRSQRTEGSQEG
jgi:hypothetical protein